MNLRLGGVVRQAVSLDLVIFLIRVPRGDALGGSGVQAVSLDLIVIRAPRGDALGRSGVQAVGLDLVLFLRRIALVLHLVLRCGSWNPVHKTVNREESSLMGKSFAEELDTDAFPGSGTVAALVAAQAASLAAAAAHRSRAGWEEAGGARAQAQALRRRALELADRNAAAYAAAREALAQPRSEAPDEEQAARDWRLGVAVEQAAGPPLELAASAAAIAELAAVISTHGADDVRVDAGIAAILAAAAARAAAQLVEINLVVGEQEASVRARAYAQAAAAAAAGAETM